MWGVGVNQPFPVRNLYPAVLTGDPEWRPYFTVNLLNLPGHYHNEAFGRTSAACGCVSFTGWACES